MVHPRSSLRRRETRLLDFDLMSSARRRSHTYPCGQVSLRRSTLLNRQFASPGFRAPSASGHDCGCGGRTAHQAAKRADLGAVRGLGAATGRKSSEPLLAGAKGGGLIQPRADKPRDATAKKKSEALLVGARETQRPANASAMAPGSQGIATVQETNAEARRASRGKPLPASAHKDR